MASPGETTVSATLVDLGGQVWRLATVQINFVPTPNIPGPYIWQGGPFSLSPQLTADGNGFFSISLPDNSTITPAGSMWRFVIAPSATMPAVVFNLQVSGSTMDISSVFTSQSYQVSQGTVQSMPVPRAYQDSEVATPPNSGQLYFNTSENQYRYSLGNGQWQNLIGSLGIYVNTANVDLNTIQIGGFYEVLYATANNPFTFTGSIGLFVWPSGDVNFGVQMVWNLTEWNQPLKIFARCWRGAPPTAWTTWAALTLS